MSSFEEEKNEIKSKIDLVEMISRTVDLKKSSKGYVGLCPFHTEKSPSFNVNNDGFRGAVGGRYYCFGCKASGDAFTWVEKTEGVPFMEAKRRLAALAGVALATVDPRKEARRARLFGAMEVAARYFGAELQKSPETLVYAQERGLDAAAVEAWELGYLPESGGLMAALKAGGVAAEDAVAAGLLGMSDRGGGVYEPKDLRGRLIFPWRDESGRIVTFSGRLTHKPLEGEKKYLNGRATEIFEKRTVLFGLYQGSRAISAARSVIIVEGYLDVVIPHQYGFKNVVGVMGTAVTPEHVAKLRRYADTIILALDPDTAGQGAMKNVVTELHANLPALLGAEQKFRVAMKILDLPEGKDPDEIILADASAWPALVATARPVLDRALAKYADRLDNEDPHAKREAANELIPLFRALSDPIAISHYRSRIRHLLGNIEERVFDTLLAEFEPGGIATTNTRTHAAPVEGDRMPRVYTPPSPLELRVLRLLLEQPGVYRRQLTLKRVPTLAPTDFDDGETRAAFVALAENEAPVANAQEAVERFGEEHTAAFVAAFDTPFSSANLANGNGNGNPKEKEDYALSRRALAELVLALRRASLRRERDGAQAAVDSAINRNDLDAGEAADVALRDVTTRLTALESALAGFAELRADSF